MQPHKSFVSQHPFELFLAQAYAHATLDSVHGATLNVNILVYPEQREARSSSSHRATALTRHAGMRFYVRRHWTRTRASWPFGVAPCPSRQAFETEIRVAMAAAYGNLSQPYNRVQNGIRDVFFRVNRNFTLHSITAAPHADASILPPAPPTFRPFFAPLVHVCPHPLPPIPTFFIAHLRWSVRAALSFRACERGSRRRLVPHTLFARLPQSWPGRLSIMGNEMTSAHRADVFYGAMVSGNLTATGLTVVVRAAPGRVSPSLPPPVPHKSTRRKLCRQPRPLTSQLTLLPRAGC